MRMGWAVPAMLAALTLMPFGKCSQAAQTPPVLGVYFESWSEAPTQDARRTQLARLPAAVDLVFIAFARPNADYAGDFDLTRTGLGFPFDGRFVRGAVAELRRRNRATRVLLSVGGATYTEWRRLNPRALSVLVEDLGLDGIDLDFEPPSPGCRADGLGSVRCATDRLYADSVLALRRALPRPAVLAVAGWSVGAFGEGAWTEELPRGRYTGLALGLLHSAAAASIDVLTVMAYDAGPTLNVRHTLAAYRALYPGPVLLGMVVDDVTLSRPMRSAASSVARDADLLRAVVAEDGNRSDGAVLYSLQMNSTSDTQPRALAAELLALMCDRLGHAPCASEAAEPLR